MPDPFRCVLPALAPLPGGVHSPAIRTATVCRAASRYCGLLGWSAVLEMPLPNGRRADVLALLPDGCFAIIEVKSCARDFLSDSKWPDYRDYCDRLYFAVDLDFPQAILPSDTGLLVAAEGEMAQLREAPSHPLAPARRRALLHRFATLAADRLMAVTDPAGFAARRSALRAE